NDCLPQGAPTSPILSNILNICLDKRLSTLAEKFNYTYTRYADDLTFSGKEIPARFIDYVRNIINDEGYFINEGKTLLQKGNGKKIITGVSISSGNLKLPRKYKRDLRQELYYIDRYGFFGHAKSEGIRDPDYLSKLLGKVSYWLSIESGNEEAIEYKKMLVEIIKERE
ncbi:MAG: hypothetical protein JXR26_01310, partial [Balneolaceae bacterium]|nr:hypothetical protein [Balneolaceae bacterium]